MAERKQFTDDDRRRQQALVRDAQKELIAIADSVDPELLKEHDKVNFDRDKWYDSCRMLRQIEGLQQVIVFHGGEQPKTWLPFLAHYAVERVKKEGIPGR
jgi:hypothetical protein